MKNRLGVRLFGLIYTARATIVGDVIIAMLASAVHKSVLILVPASQWADLVRDIQQLPGCELNSDGCTVFAGIPITVVSHHEARITVLQDLDPGHVRIAWSPETPDHIAVLDIARANREVFHAMPPAIFAKFTNAVVKTQELEVAHTMLTL